MTDSRTFRGLLVWLLLAGPPALADGITVKVLDHVGNPVPDVAVYATGDATGVSSGHGKKAVMDQADRRFVPHLLVIQRGTDVDFPNSDVIAHHVYSFSRPNDFILPLYKGDAHPPVDFEHTGVVTLGCNIHDHMLAYILVVDTPLFGKTDADGVVEFDTTGQAIDEVSIWSPRIRPGDEILTKPAAGQVEFRLTGRLRPPHDGDDGGIEWTDY